jgi:hypothetical protein
MPAAYSPFRNHLMRVLLQYTLITSRPPFLVFFPLFARRSTSFAMRSALAATANICSLMLGVGG